MDIELPTEKLALKIWWAMLWRTIPLAILVSLLAGIVIGTISGVMGVDSNEVQIPASIAGGLLGLYVSVKVIKHLMTKGFSGYRLVVVRI